MMSGFVWSMVCIQEGSQLGFVEPGQNLPVRLDLKPLTSEKQQCVRYEEKDENQETSNEQSQVLPIADIQERNVAIIQMIEDATEVAFPPKVMGS